MNTLRRARIPAVALIGLLVAACGGSGTASPAAPTSAAPASPVAQGSTGTASPVAQTTLNVLWYVNSDQETAVMHQLLNEYSQLHPDVAFNLH
ncbi:MAG: hypothetical protein M1337_07540, partial [Actinobacteria bacterium]|nr:hypothetical protein [Actinomycetota bacterium]